MKPIRITESQVNRIVKQTIKEALSGGNVGRMLVSLDKMKQELNTLKKYASDPAFFYQGQERERSNDYSEYVAQIETAIKTMYSKIMFG